MSLKMKYFVLKPKGDDPYAIASCKAMRTYASAIEITDPDLAQGLREWADYETYFRRSGSGKDDKTS